MNEKEKEKENENKYLVFKIGGGIYASPLLSIREVLEYQSPKFMPNMSPHFVGVINVRGSIVGVTDLRLKLSVPSEILPRTALLLCDTERGSMAAIVDCVESVAEFNSESLDRSPPVNTKTEVKYLLGVAKANDLLITVVDLHRLLNEDEYRAA